MVFWSASMDALPYRCAQSCRSVPPMRRQQSVLRKTNCYAMHALACVKGLTFNKCERAGLCMYERSWEQSRRGSNAVEGRGGGKAASLRMAACHSTVVWGFKLLYGGYYCTLMHSKRCDAVIHKDSFRRNAFATHECVPSAQPRINSKRPLKHEFTTCH